MRKWITPRLGSAGLVGVCFTGRDAGLGTAASIAVRIAAHLPARGNWTITRHQPRTLQSNPPDDPQPSITRGGCVFMKTYDQKLQDPRWHQFADAYRDRIRQKHYGGDSPECHSCGKGGPLQVHHRRYYQGREPWEYDDEDLILICGECHKRIHAVANEFYSWLISLEPSTAYEARYLLEELLKCDHPQIALAKCKGVVRNFNHQVQAKKERSVFDPMEVDAD